MMTSSSYEMRLDRYSQHWASPCTAATLVQSAVVSSQDCKSLPAPPRAQVLSKQTRSWCFSLNPASRLRGTVPVHLFTLSWAAFPLPGHSSTESTQTPSVLPSSSLGAFTVCLFPLESPTVPSFPSPRPHVSLQVSAQMALALQAC